MARIQNSVQIRRPVAEVFAYIVNPANSPSWDATVIDATQSEVPVRVGTLIRTRVKFLSRNGEIQRQVIVYEPDTRFVTESLKPFPLTIAWTFAPENGGTRVVRDGHLQTSGIFGFLAPILQRIGWRTDQASLERMKALLEGEQSRD